MAKYSVFSPDGSSMIGDASTSSHASFTSSSVPGLHVPVVFRIVTW